MDTPLIRRVRVLRRGQADLEAIERYVAVDSPAAAARLVDRLLEAIESLSELAERAVTPKDARLASLGFRCLSRRPYLIFFRLHRAEVRVHRILHGRRAYQHLL